MESENDVFILHALTLALQAGGDQGLISALLTLSPGCG
jgi:hypothetical protein